MCFLIDKHLQKSAPRRARWLLSASNISQPLTPHRKLIYYTPVPSPTLPIKQMIQPTNIPKLPQATELKSLTISGRSIPQSPPRRCSRCCGCFIAQQSFPGHLPARAQRLRQVAGVRAISPDDLLPWASTVMTRHSPSRLQPLRASESFRRRRS